MWQGARRLSHRQTRRGHPLRYAVASSKCETSSIKPHPPTADAWPHTSLSAYQRVPSSKLLAWAGPYASGRTRSTPTSTQPEPATHPTEAINEHYRTRQTHRQRLPQPHQLPAPNAPHCRRPRYLHPHPTRKNQQCARRPCATRRPLSYRHQNRASGRLHRLGTPSDRAGYTTTSTDSAQPLSPNLSSTQYLLSPGQAHLPAARKTHTPTVAALRAGEQRSDRPPRLRDHFGKQNAIGTVVD